MTLLVHQFFNNKYFVFNTHINNTIATHEYLQVLLYITIPSHKLYLQLKKNNKNHITTHNFKSQEAQVACKNTNIYRVFKYSIFAEISIQTLSRKGLQYYHEPYIHVCTYNCMLYKICYTHALTQNVTNHDEIIIIIKIIIISLFLY